LRVAIVSNEPFIEPRVSTPIPIPTTKHTKHTKCSNKYSSSGGTQIHRQRSVKTKTIVDYPFVCSMCPKMYTLNGNLDAHIKAVHRNLKPFHCFKCQKGFSFKANYQRHVQLMHEKSKSFQCLQCHKKFSLKDYLSRHVKTIHTLKM
jgi:uncharacterized Zn-finger protein